MKILSSRGVWGTPILTLHMKTYRGFWSRSSTLQVEKHQPTPTTLGVSLSMEKAGCGNSAFSRVWRSITLLFFNIAMETQHFNRYIIYKWVIFHGYVSHNQRVVGFSIVISAIRDEPPSFCG